MGVTDVNLHCLSKRLNSFHKLFKLVRQCRTNLRIQQIKISAEFIPFGEITFAQSIFALSYKCDTIFTFLPIHIIIVAQK